MSLGVCNFFILFFMISKSKVYVFLKDDKCELQSSKCAQGCSMPWIIMDSMLNNNIYNIYI